MAQRGDRDALLRVVSRMLLRDTSDQDDGLGLVSHEFSILRLLERVLIGLKGDIDQDICIPIILTIQAYNNFLIR